MSKIGRDMVFPAVVAAFCTAAWAVSLFYPLESYGYYEGCPLFNRVSYMFVHTGLLHLAVNMYAFFSVSRAATSRHRPAAVFLPAFLAGVAMTFGTEHVVPTCGLSGVVYFLLGFHAAGAGRSVFVATSALCVVAWLVSHAAGLAVNNTVHAAGFMYGILYHLLNIGQGKREKHADRHRGAQEHRHEADRQGTAA